jgi:hypothetical protein
MKKIFSIIVFCTFTMCDIVSQNLLINGDFEGGDDTNLENDCYYQDYYNENRVNIWKSEYSNRKRLTGALLSTDCGKTSQPANCDLCARHSPDWFNDASYYVNNTLGPIMNLGSNHIAGLGGYEVLQQNLNNVLENNTNYFVQFKLFVPSKFRNQNTDQSQSKLTFLISKSRIEYKKDYFVHDETYYPPELSCPNGYTEYQDGIYQDIKQMCEFNLNDYPKNQWIDVYCNYYHTSGYGYNWFAFDIHNHNEHCTKGYAYVDDIVFAEGCINGCSSTAGAYSISTSGSHTQYQPFTVFGLQNISEVILEIWTTNGQTLFNSIHIQNPPDKIAWNGKNSNGYELPPTDYHYKIYATNDCGTKFISDNFPKTNAAPTVDSYPYFNYNSVSKPPLPDCCVDHIVIQNQNLVQDKTIGAPDPLLYKAGISITAGPTVVVNAESDVVFEAGDMIVLDAGFTVEAGANFSAIIEPCIDLSNKNMLTENHNNWNYNNYSNLFETTNPEQQESISENNFFSIHPNPFNDSFTITDNPNRRF